MLLDKDMKILHSGSLDVKSGGPALSTYLTIKGLLSVGVETDIIMPPLNKNGRLISDDVTIHYTKHVVNTRLGYMPNIEETLG